MLSKLIELEKRGQLDYINKILSYLYVPYQVLQITGYRLVGKPCEYQWRRYRPEPVGVTAKWQHLIGGLFPIATLCVMLLLQVAFFLYAFHDYFSPQYPWMILLLAVQPLPFSLYGSCMAFDWLRVRRLLAANKNPN